MTANLAGIFPSSEFYFPTLQFFLEFFMLYIHIVLSYNLYLLFQLTLNTH
jgi:hypothetical protein